MNVISVIKFLYTYRNYILALFSIGVIWLFLNIHDNMRKYREEADRWRTNYTILDQRFGEDVGAYEVRVQQMEFTMNELNRQSTIQIEELKHQLRRSGIKVKDLEHALAFQQKISDTLYITQIDTVLMNCLKQTVHLEFADSLSKIDVYLNPDLTAQATYEVEASIYGFIHREVSPMRDRRTGVGKFIANTSLKYGATRWMVKKKVVYNTDIKSNNPNLQLYNVQSLRIIEN